ncbi:unknown protein [Microcystis aeruginosa NIES-843]|uniref:Uncharacterized protein n=1 Tax=Microcystis aeruginosa (strain NIES-843 / IAM M-2473) TaxID=449447 RepID=B0JQ61_MICAN|nr:unknown protein [Microcystis aeruginosa NIES-843]
MRPYHWRNNIIVGANCLRPQGLRQKVFCGGGVWGRVVSFPQMSFSAIQQSF